MAQLTPRPWPRGPPQVLGPPESNQDAPEPQGDQVPEGYQVKRRRQEPEATQDTSASSNPWGEGPYFKAAMDALKRDIQRKERERELRAQEAAKELESTQGRRKQAAEKKKQDKIAKLREEDAKMRMKTFFPLPEDELDTDTHEPAWPERALLMFEKSEAELNEWLAKERIDR